MEELISFQTNLLSSVTNEWHRYLYPKLKTGERLLGLKGLRGVGKTTMLLQYLAFDYDDKEHGLYVTVDHPYFYGHKLFDLASDWHKYGGKLLLIDEVHKYADWSRELKLIYDGLPELNVVFTSSSALNLYRGESDLSRRLITQNLHGLSFREYLNFIHGWSFPAYSLNEVLNESGPISKSFPDKFKPLPLFKSYLKDGYFPFIRQVESETISSRLTQIINTILESDLAAVQNYSAANISKIKKLLGAIAVSAPFEPNISKIASRLKLGRNTVKKYLHHLQDAQLLKLLNRPAKGMSQLQKPDKIYFENANFAYAFQPEPNIGTIRETFAANQISNAGHAVHLPNKGDFLIDEQWVVEVGGKNKGSSQIKNIENAFLALDDIEYGYGRKIPLWLLGFLY